MIALFSTAEWRIRCGDSDMIAGENRLWLLADEGRKAQGLLSELQRRGYSKEQQQFPRVPHLHICNNIKMKNFFFLINLVQNLLKIIYFLNHL